MADDEEQNASQPTEGEEPRYLTADEILESVPIRFSLRNRPVRLQALSAGQFDEMAADATDSNLTDRQFVERFIARQAVEPRLESSAVAEWSDAELLDALRQWVEQSNDDVEVEGDLKFESFRAWAHGEAERVRTQMQEIYDRMADSVNIGASAAQFARIAAQLTPHIDTSLLDRLSSPLARWQLEGVLGPTKALEDYARRLTFPTITTTRATEFLAPDYPSGGGIPVGGPGAQPQEVDEQFQVDAEDGARALQEAEEATQRLAMDQVVATRELVSISQGQAANTLAVLGELRGMHVELKSGSRWSKAAAIGAWASVAVGVVASVIAGFALWASLASGSPTDTNDPTSPPAIESPSAGS